MKMSDRLRKEIEALEKEKSLLEEDIDRYKKQKTEEVKQLQLFDDTVDVARQKMADLVRKEPWISKEESFFGQEGTMYDFRDVEPLALSKEIEDNDAEKEELKKKFDPRVDELAKKNQEMYTELERKRNTIKADKERLEETIKILDEERNKDIKKTVVEVSKSLGEIYSVLLPGTFAQLQPVLDAEQDNAIVGLELKVAFGGVEKESLSELSGGQKSLLALSLILALLKYQPAPFYILDEVDSALDLSHTQNIGLMIRKYFQASQFLIVSLKQGFF